MSIVSDTIRLGDVIEKRAQVKMPLWRRIRYFYLDHIKSNMGAADKRVAVSLCGACDGGCCRCIGVPGFWSELIKISIRPGNWFRAHFWQHLYAITFSAIMMVDEEPELINKDLTRNGMKLKRCRAIGSGGRCRVYKLQPWYCYSFKCDGKTMAYHIHAAGKGLSVPEHIKRRM